MARERKFDTEAHDAAAEIADSIVASVDGRATGIIVGMRAYRKGQRTRDPELARLEAQLAELKTKLAVAENNSVGTWTPYECQHVATLHKYGMKLAEIAKLTGTSVAQVREALRLNKDKRFRTASDRLPPVPGRRQLDAD